MVNKVAQEKKKQKLSTSQIFDDFDIDEKSLCGYVKDGRQMNPTLHLITCVWWALIFALWGFGLKSMSSSIMSLRAQAHDILLNHDFHTSVHNMNLWPYMKIVLHSEKYCIMD